MLRAVVLLLSWVAASAAAERRPSLLLLLWHSWSRRRARRRPPAAGVRLLLLVRRFSYVLTPMVRLLQLCQQRLDGVVSRGSDNRAFRLRVRGLNVLLWCSLVSLLWDGGWLLLGTTL